MTYPQLSGTGSAANGAADTEIIAATAGKITRLQKAVVSVSLAAVGGGGEVALEDAAGGTRIWEADADALGVYNIDFGELGYPLTAGNALNLTVDGAVTTQATAYCTAVAIQAD